MTFKKILRKINNRYFYATVGFLIIFLFVDQFNVFEQWRLKRTLKTQRQQIEYYKTENEKNKQFLYDLENDTITQEKEARENYMMKRDNEVVYLIEMETPKQDNDK